MFIICFPIFKIFFKFNWEDIVKIDKLNIINGYSSLIIRIIIINSTNVNSNTNHNNNDHEILRIKNTNSDDDVDDDDDIEQ